MAKTSSAAKKSRSTKSAAAAALTQELVVHTAESAMAGDTEVIVEDGAGSAIDALLLELEEPTATGSAPIETHADATLEAAVSGAEASEISLASATPEGVVDAGAVPTGTVSDADPAATTEAAAPKRVPVPRKHYSDKVERLKDRMGDGLAEFSVLTMADASVTDEELKAKMDETLAIIKGMNKKEQARASMFLEFLAGKKAKPNEILARALTVLKRDGHISTGKDGNLMVDLLAATYSHGAARAMGGNTVSMLADLKVLNTESKGKFVANPESLLLMKANSLMFAAPAEAAEPAAA